MASSYLPRRTLKRPQVIVDTEKNCNWAGPNLRGGSARWLLALATFVLSAAAQAQAPTANLDTFPDVPEDAVNFLMDVASNDEDNGAVIDLASVVVNPGDEPNNGVATANGDGTINYTPTADYFGPDSFNYIICNTVPECSIGSVDITVDPVNDIPVLTLNGADPISLGTGDIYNEPDASATDVEDNNAALTNQIVVGGDTVDTAVPATYTVTYDVTDSGGAPAVQITRAVIVTDDDAPVITLTGAAIINLNVGDSYNEQGATATDNVNGSVAVTIGGDTVNTGAAGTYVVTYDASDTAGNNATQVTRTVNVVAVPDSNPPVISLNGAATINLNFGATYNEQGATATDPEEGNVSVTIGGDTVNTSVAGTYFVTYDASDSVGNNATQVTRTVNVAADSNPPVISRNGPATINLNFGATYNEQGATATDPEEGNVSVTIGGDTVNTSVAGTYIVTYNASDSVGNNATQVTRTVNVAPDSNPPVITRNGAATINLPVGGNYNEQGATATDPEEGSVAVTIGGDTVNTNVAGTYIVTYNASDSSGNNATQVTRTVNVSDNNPPVITLNGAATINLAVGGNYNEQGATATDPEEGNVAVTIGGATVNTNVAGSYIVTYNASDSAGNNATQVTRTVNVSDSNAPVITLNGAATINLSVGGTYNEPGATATDPEEGTVAVIIGGDTVNTGVAGTYIVTYNASDSAGNNAVQVTRTVNVNDGNPPVITRIGPATVNLDAGDTYIEQGATATDPEEGTVTVIIGGDTVNTAVAGTYIVTYNASDSAGNNAAEVIRTVNVAAGNRAPIVTTPITNQTATEGAPYSLDVLFNFSDPDGDTLTFSATGLPPSLDPIDAIDGIIFGNPTQAEAEANGGVYNVTVTATDPSNESVSSSFTLTISAVDDPPVVVTPIGDRTADEGVLYTLDVSANFNDPDGGALTFSATGLPASLDPIGATDGVIDGIPTQAESEFNGGVYNVTVTATDPTNESVSDSFVLTIGTVNDPPVAIPQAVSTNEDEFINFVLAGSDPENDVLTFAIFSPPLNGTAGSIGADATYTPNLDFSGTDSFTFTVNDGEFTSLPATVTITVVAVNDPPIVLLPIEEQLGVEGTPFSLTVTGNFVDPDGDPLTYIASGLPPSGNVTFNGQTGIFSGTPRQEDARDNDPYLITVSATDGGVDGVAVDEFALNISALNRANVSLDVIVSPNPAMQNDQLRWTYTVRNTLGPQVAPNVVLNGSFFGTGLTVTTANACTILAPVGQVTNFSCVVGPLPLGASTAVVLSTATGAVGDVATFATAEGADPLPIDPNLDDNSKQTAVGVAASFSNGAVNVLGASNIRSVAFGDVSGDGVGDLVVGTSAGQPIQVWLGDGFRGFAAAPLTVADTAANEGVALADFNGNGRLDLVVANGGGQADLVYRNDGAGNFTLMRTLGSTFAEDVAVGDFDNDGTMDIAFATILGNPVYLGNGAGGFTLHATLGTANSQAVAVARFDADARDDLVFANVGGPSRVWIKNAGDGFLSRDLAQVGDAIAVTVGELGGNASTDIAFGRTSSGIGDVPANPVLINDGTGQFAAPLALLGSATTTDIHAGDVDSDGLADLVFINSSGVHQTWVNTGAGFRLHAEQIFSADAAAGVLAEIGMTDVGDPGGFDLAMGGTLQTGLGVFLNDGFGNLGMGDAVMPVLTLIGDATLIVPSGSVYEDPGAMAEDNIDGTISVRIVVDNPVNTATLGTYTVTYNVADLAGNAAAPITRTVNVAPATGGGGGGGGSLNPFVVFLLMLAALLAVHRAKHAIILVSGQKQK